MLVTQKHLTKELLSFSLSVLSALEHSFELLLLYLYRVCYLLSLFSAFSSRVSSIIMMIIID